MVDDCGVNGTGGAGRCFCDRGCYEQEICCSDIGQVPCLEGKKMSSYCLYSLQGNHVNYHVCKKILRV